MIVRLRQALDRMPGNVDAMIGLAGLHLQLGMLDAAAEWCLRAAALVPDAPAVGRVRAAVANACVQRGLSEVIGGHLDDAIGTLSRAADMTGGGDARLYRDLFALAASWYAEAAQLPPAPGVLRISLPVWGADYVDAVTSGLLRTLLAPGNLPALARRRAVRIEITTSAADRARLEESPSVAAIRRHAEVAYFILPDAVLQRPAPADVTYWTMSVAHHASVERARRTGGDVSFFTADMILSDRCLDVVQDAFEAGAQAILVGALEADRAAVVAGEGDDALALAPGTLVRHGLAQLGLDPRGAGPGASRALTPSTFAIEGGVAQYGFHLLPIMVSSELLSRDFAYDLLTVDTRFVGLALGGTAPDGRVTIIGDTDDMAVVSTLRAGGAAASPPPADAEALGRWAAGWCFTPADAAWFEWCFRQRRVFRTEAGGTVPDPDAREQAAIADALGAFRRHAMARLTDQKRSSTDGA
jgi:hypothetical protein